MTVKTKELREGRDILNSSADSARKKHELTKASVPGELKKFYGYEEMLGHVLRYGVPKADRTGTGTTGVHGYQLRFDLENGFPMVTTKKVFLKAVTYELLWLLKGDTNIRYLAQNGVKIWNDWPYKNYRESTSFLGETMDEFVQKIIEDESFSKKWGDLGPVYGKQWRNWKTPQLEAYDEGYTYLRIDQIQVAIDQLKREQETGVMNRRVIVVAWNPADINDMSKSGLPPCHCFFQFHSSLMSLEERRSHWAKKNNQVFSWSQEMGDDELDAAGAPFLKLDLQLYQRSCDIFLGVPFNIASYALLLMMVAQVTNMKPGEFIHDYGDLHIYSNHLDQVVEQLSRIPYPYPTIVIANRGQGIDGYMYSDFQIENYQCHPSIQGDVAV